MSVKFGKDGTLYCNTVKYNYKQTRNLVADNGYKYGYWILDNTVIEIDTKDTQPSAFYIKFPSGDGVKMSVEVMPTPIANHKYYGGIFWKTTGSSFSIADGRFEWFHTDGDNNVQLTFATKNVATNGNWVKLSSILQAGSNPSEGQWTIRNFIVNGTTDSYCSKPIIVDLTECFGEGNEPTKEWCDENILEWNKFIGANQLLFNETNVSTSITFDGMTYASVYNITNGNQYFFNRTDIPRSYNVDMQSGTFPECNIHLPEANIDTQRKVYAFVELSQPNGNRNKSYDWYVPIAHPPLDSISQVENGQFNSGGGLYNWKRISFLNWRDAWTTGSYPNRFDLNNGGDALYLALTNFCVTQPYSLLLSYSKYFKIGGFEGTFADTLDKTFCDRWYGGDGDFIIHIKNHLNKTIKFNTDYDIVCNDIEIRPETNKISLRTDGTIVCKNLVRVQKY